MGRCSRIIAVTVVVLKGAFWVGGGRGQLLRRRWRADFIAAGPDGNMWFTSRWDRIGRITPSGVMTEFDGVEPGQLPLGNRAGAQWEHVVRGSGGDWTIGPCSGERIGRITPAGVITKFFAGLSPVAIRVASRGPDGNRWFTEGGQRGDFRRRHPDRPDHPGGSGITEFSKGLQPGRPTGGIVQGPTEHVV